MARATALWAMPPLRERGGRPPDDRTGNLAYLHLILIPGQTSWIRANVYQLHAAKQYRFPYRLELGPDGEPVLGPPIGRVLARAILRRAA